MNLNKNNLRNTYKNYDKSKYSDLIIMNLKKENLYKKSKNIMIFYPLKNEINLLSLLNDKKKNFYLPRISNETLCCCPYAKNDQLLPSKFNLLEPCSKECDKNSIDLIIVPALCCDKNGYRLGYGGGYYDRFLKDYKGIKVVCLPKQLVLDTVYPEVHDIKMDYIVTD